MAVIWVELLDLRQRVRARVRLDRFPATLGRGYASDVPIDNPTVSAAHARIEEGEGRLVLVDAGSRNGVRLAKGMKTVERVELGAETIVRLGEAVVRLRDPGMPLAVTGVYPLHSRAEQPWVVLTLFVGATALIFAGEYLASTWRFDAAKELGALFMIWMAAASWAFAWAYATWMVHHQYRFAGHFSAIATFVAAMPLLILQRKLLAFSLSAPRAAAASMWVTVFGLVALVLFLHLRLIRVGQLRRNLVLALLISGGLAGTIALISVSKPSHWVGVPRFSRELLPPAFRVAPARTTAQFFEDAKGLGEELEKARDKD